MVGITKDMVLTKKLSFQNLVLTIHVGMVSTNRVDFAFYIHISLLDSVKAF